MPSFNAPHFLLFLVLGCIIIITIIIIIIILLLLAAMTYNKVHYFWVNDLADFTQNGHTKIQLYIDLQATYMYGMSCTDSSARS